MVDNDGWSGKFSSLLHSPNERVEARIDCASRTAAFVEINRAQTNHGTERLLPSEACQFGWNFRIALKFQSVRSRSRLILIDHQRTNEAYAVVTQLPGAVVAIGGASKRPASKHQQITAALQITVDRWPCLLGID